MAGRVTFTQNENLSLIRDLQSRKRHSSNLSHCAIRMKPDQTKPNNLTREPHRDGTNKCNGAQVQICTVIVVLRCKTDKSNLLSLGRFLQPTGKWYWRLQCNHVCRRRLTIQYPFLVLNRPNRCSPSWYLTSSR